VSSKYADINSDEVMYQARLHPEQYSNTFTDEQIKRLHDAIMYVCDTAIEANGDSDEFPKDWLMKHRWGKGKKDAQTLPNGEKITFLKVGGRTSAIVPSVQKKTAAVAGDVSEGAEDDGAEEDAKPKKGSKRKAKAVKEEEEADEAAPVKPKRGRKNVKEVEEEAEDATEEKSPSRPKRASKKVQEEVKEEESDAAEEVQSKKRKTAASGTAKQSKARAKEELKSGDSTGKRRSGRLSK
jgi:formamidopyrimidine-DNA glycosylase